MINFPQVTLIYDRYKKASSLRTATIEVRISYNRKQKYISTGIRVLPSQWRKGRIVNSPNSVMLNMELDNILNKVRQDIYDMYNKGSIDIFSISSKVKNNDVPCILDYFRQRAKIKKYGKKKDTQARYDRFIRLFTEWGKIKCFADITDENIISYDQYLSSKGMKDYSKWQNYHRFLNGFILDAMEEGLLHRNPYKWVNIYKGKNNDSLSKFLTSEEFHRIRTAKLSTESLNKVRDVFVFQTYTCLSYTDLMGFDANKIITIHGMKVYTGKRDKTGKEFTIPLLKQALAILHKYDNKLPLISNVKYNAYLKVVAQSAGIDKPITTHWARHTGATLLLNEGVPMKIVSRICGHSNTRITEMTYAKLLDETVVNAIIKLDDKV